MNQYYARGLVESIPSLYSLSVTEAEALESILSPKQLVHAEIGEGDRAEIIECCPNCLYEISDSSYKYCPICGQLILREE